MRALRRRVISDRGPPMLTRKIRRPLPLGVALSLLLCGTAAAQAPQPPAPLPAPLPLFPPDNWWNVDISGGAGRCEQRWLHQLHRRRDVTPSGLRRGRRHAVRHLRDDLRRRARDHAPRGRRLQLRLPQTRATWGRPGRPPGISDSGRRPHAAALDRGRPAGRRPRRRPAHAARGPPTGGSSTSCSHALERGRRALGGGFRAPSSLSTATAGGRRGGRAPTPRGSPSFPGSSATTRLRRAARSGMRSA